jgi:ubiquinone biosynthesis protein
MWMLARPLIEDWMRQNRGPEARLRDAAADFAGLIERTPSMLRSLEAALSRLAAEGATPGRAATAAARDGRVPGGLAVPLWIAALALLAIAAALW